MSNDQPRSTTRYSRYSRSEVVPPKAPAPNPAKTKPEVSDVDKPMPNRTPAPTPRTPSAPRPAEPSFEEITSKALNVSTRSATIRPQRDEPIEVVDLQPPVPDVEDYEPERVRRVPPRQPIPEVVPVRQTVTSWKDREELEEPSLAPDWPEPMDNDVAPAPSSVAPVIRALEPESSEASSETPQVLRKNAAEKPKKEGPNIAQRALAKARAKAVPMLQKSALWLAHNLQRRELRKRYSEAVIFTHNRVIDRGLEKLFFVPTLKGVVKSPAPERGIHYEGPIPSRVFNWVLASLPADVREFAFIDFRAGRGRTMLLAAKRQFDRIIGFEFDGQLFDDLQMNVAQYPRSLMKCRNIDCYRGDLEGIRVPNQASVLWFSGAWRDNMIPGVMDYVRQTYKQSPRALYVVFANAGEEEVLPNDPLFQRIEPNMSERVKLKLLSPMEFQFYRAIP
jgi:hypothetical protein